MHTRCSYLCFSICNTALKQHRPASVEPNAEQLTTYACTHDRRAQSQPKLESLCADCSEAAQLATCTWEKKWQSLWNCRSPPLHDPDKNALNEITESAKILCAASSEAAEIATCAFEKWQNLRNCTHVFLQWQFDRIEQHHCSVGARYKISWNHGSVWWLAPAQAEDAWVIRVMDNVKGLMKSLAVSRSCLNQLVYSMPCKSPAIWSATFEWRGCEAAKYSGLFKASTSLGWGRLRLGRLIANGFQAVPLFEPRDSFTNSCS